MTGGWFNRTVCLAFTWDATRRCRGVRMRKTRQGMVVEDGWEAAPRDGMTLGAVLGEGFQALRGDETCTVVAGPADWPGTVVDLAMPRLELPELTRALRFELARQVPVPADQLVFGFRLLPEAGTGTTRPVRLACIREDAWQTLLTDLSGLAPGLDLFLPPVLALDPVLAGRAAAMPAGDVFAPAGNGPRREFISADAPAGNGQPPFGAGANPLADPRLIPGDAFAAKPGAVQQEYAGAVILGMYGLEAPAGDGKTWLPLPRELRIRRNRAARLTALALGGYALLALAGLLAVTGAHNMQQIRALRANSARLEKRIKSYGADKDERLFLTKLQTEFKDARVTKSSLPACLGEISDRLSPDAWVQLFSWNDGKIEVELSTADATLDAVGDMQASPLFADVVPLRKKVDEKSGITSIRLQLLAGDGAAKRRAAANVTEAPGDQAGAGNGLPDAGGAP